MTGSRCCQGHHRALELIRDTYLDTPPSHDVAVADLFKAHLEQFPEDPWWGSTPQRSGTDRAVGGAGTSGLPVRDPLATQPHRYLHTMHRYLPGQSEYNKRLRKLARVMA